MQRNKLDRTEVLSLIYQKIVVLLSSVREIVSVFGFSHNL